MSDLISLFLRLFCQKDVQIVPFLSLCSMANTTNTEKDLC
jgi:hypothetical protein